MSAEIIVAFDYGRLETDGRKVAQAAAKSIRARMARTAEDLVAIGAELRRVKASLGHGVFLKWIDAELGISDRTARNLMRVAETFADKAETISDFAPSVLYALASPSTPETVRELVAERATAGEPVTIDDIRQMTAKLSDVVELNARPVSARAVWRKLHRSMIGLADLPSAAEVASIARERDEDGEIAERIAAVRRWLADFDAAWRRAARGGQ